MSAPYTSHLYITIIISISADLGDLDRQDVPALGGGAEAVEAAQGGVGVAELLQLLPQPGVGVVLLPGHSRAPPLEQYCCLSCEG